MVVISIVAILAAILVPGMSDIFARNSLTSAQQDLMQAIRKAKAVARNQNTAVTITLVADSPRITLTSADGRFTQNIDLPGSVSPATSATYRFNPLGLLDQTGTITLNSSLDGTQTKTITIQTLFGQLEAG